MVPRQDAAPRVTSRRAARSSGRQIGAERITDLLAVADAAGMALVVLEEAVRSAREDLESALLSVRAVDEQRRTAQRAASALDDAGERADQHLRAVDQLAESASRSVGAALAESGAEADESVLEQLDSWADLSRIERDALHRYRRDQWGLAEALEALAELHSAEARRLQQVIERRAALLTTLTGLIAEQAEAARSVTEPN